MKWLNVPWGARIWVLKALSVIKNKFKDFFPEGESWLDFLSCCSSLRRDWDTSGKACQSLGKDDLCWPWSLQQLMLHLRTQSTGAAVPHVTATAISYLHSTLLSTSEPPSRCSIICIYVWLLFMVIYFFSNILLWSRFFFATDVSSLTLLLASQCFSLILCSEF